MMASDASLEFLGHPLDVLHVSARASWIHLEIVEALEVRLECADCAFLIRPNAPYVEPLSSRGRYKSVLRGHL